MMRRIVRNRQATSSLEFVLVVPVWFLAFFLILALYLIFVNGMMLQNALAQSTLRIGAAGCSSDLIDAEYMQRASAAGAWIWDFDAAATNTPPSTFGASQAKSAAGMPAVPLQIKVWQNGQWQNVLQDGFGDTSGGSCDAIGSDDEPGQGHMLQITARIQYAPLAVDLPGLPADKTAIKLQRQTVVLAQSVKTTGEGGN